MNALRVIGCVSGAVVAALLASCSHTVMLRNTAVPLAKTARMADAPARFFIDTIKVPYRKDQRIGEKKALSGRFWARVYSSGDLAQWADREWRVFLTRHNQTVVARYRDADYTITCDIIEISADKKYDWIWDDDFSGSVKMTVKIVQRATARTAFYRTLRGEHFMQRRGLYAEASDDELLNLCLSSAFQKALEQVTFDPRVR